jgi:two-component system, NtrC family, nitrogen regulation sensor histidine kinase NtrY
VNAHPEPSLDSRPRWRRRLSVALRRGPVVRMIEAGVLLALVAVLALTWYLVAGRGNPAAPLSPPVVAALLVANLVPAMALMVLFARRVAMRRAARSALAGRSRLHTRLVAVFSLVASVPTLLVVVFASLLFQYGAEFWFSDRARGMLENAARLAQDNYDSELQRVGLEVVTMGGDLALLLEDYPIDSPIFAEAFGRQVYQRNLSEAVILRLNEGNSVQSLILVDPYDRDLETVVTPQMIAALQPDRPSLIVSDDRFAALARFPAGENVYIYTARVFEPVLVTQLQRGGAVLQDYRTLVNRSRDLQLRFHAALIVVSLLIVAIAIWIAMRVADRMVRPLGDLVDAARRITAGDLSARVPRARVQDEIGTLGAAFNRMTGRLETQTGALVAANAQLDSRRAFIEAVLSGVTAGVISVDDAHRIRLVNSSAEALLKTEGASLAGQRLAEVAPELDRQLAAEAREDIIQISSHGEPRTLAVKTVKVEGGHVLTFDDITEQLLDQRRAAWSDVARRIAHEIKNPLTPIQLAAERLQRRYGGEVQSDPATFERLTGTIVRQVGDLRRMVDEFSSFARMPKPVFREEQVAEIARQALFLHEVAHPDIAFRLEAGEDRIALVCDRRLLGQALTNVVKNGVEAIQQKREEKGGSDGEDSVTLALGTKDGRLCIEVTDTGIGLPADRGRLTEPYMTTRAKGTGLGLAIVKKIVEEHFGSIEFGDAPGGGTIVRLVFDAETLARLGSGGFSENKVVNG